MFTGIIKNTGIIRDASGGKLVLYSPGLSSKPGDSIAVDGICLTVSEIHDDVICFDVMPETMRRTIIGGYKENQRVNIESALRIGDSLDGHFVGGHVDCVGEVIKIENNENAKVIIVSFPEEFSRYVVEKGSIAVNGVSLTVVDVFDTEFSVSLVKYTLENTNLGDLKVVDRVNLEADLIARYIYKLKTL